jgi:hypothetical protein
MRYLRENYSPAVPFSVIARLLNRRWWIVRKQWLKWKKHGQDSLATERPPIFDQEMIGEIIDFIVTRWSDHRPATDQDIRTLTSRKWNIVVCPDTLRHILAELTDISSAIAYPMEVERMNVPEEAIFRWITRLRKSIKGVPSPFVYNMDEIGHQEYADATERKCFISSHQEQKQ